MSGIRFYLVEGLVCVWVLSGCFSVFAQEAATPTITVSSGAVITKVKVEKGCYYWDVYVEGYVENNNGHNPLSGVLVTGTISEGDDVNAVWYYDHGSYYNDWCYSCHYPNGLSMSRSLTNFNGYYQLRFDLCVDDEAYNWDAEFALAASLYGFMTDYDSASFDNEDYYDERDFDLVPEAPPTPTPTISPTISATPTPTASVTPTDSVTPTATLTPSPTRTPTNSGLPPASHPEFDADKNGIIEAQDLFLFLQDWKHQTK